MISRPRATTSSRSLKNSSLSQSNLETITPNLQVVLNNYAQQAAVGGSLDTRKCCSPTPGRSAKSTSRDAGGRRWRRWRWRCTSCDSPDALLRSERAGPKPLRRSTLLAVRGRQSLAPRRGRRITPGAQQCAVLSRVIYPRSIFLWLYLDELLLSDHVSLSREDSVLTALIPFPSGGLLLQCAVFFETFLHRENRQVVHTAGPTWH
jgi:hypothetical protein